MMLFFTFYFITVYLLIAVYPYFMNGMNKLVDDLTNAFQWFIIASVTFICIMIKKWRKLRNNG